MAVDGTIKEKKKKIKEGGTKSIAQYHPTSVQTNVKTEQSEQHEYDATKKKKKKKIKEEKVKENNLVFCEASAKTAVKTEPMEINSGKRGQEENDVPQKKKKKKNKKEMEYIQEEVMEIKMDGDHLEESRVKKVKKKRDKQMEVNVTETGEIKKKKKKKEVEVKEEEVDVGNNGEIDKKKKKKRRNIEDEVRNPKAEDGEIKKKRKKTEAHVKTEESQACIGDEPTKKKTKKEKNTSLKTESNVECVEEKVKTKKKKKFAPVEEDVEEMNAHKKKKKRLESIDEGPARLNGMKEKANVTGDVIGKVKTSDQKKKKNFKVKVDDVTEKIKEELVEKKRSKKDRNESTEKEDIVFLSAKPGNQDEVSIDQARRLALQKEIDQESQPEVNVGQWSTAQFDSSERQAKFLRLMGGFKKSSQPITGSAGRANMALGTEGQQTLQQGLLGEFERAQSRHMDFGSRGTGLGFSPPSNKKFAIDVNARKSIRFDD